MYYWRKFAWFINHYGTLWLVLTLVLSAVTSIAMYHIFMKHQAPRLREAHLAWWTPVVNLGAALFVIVLGLIAK
jgi:hypothetical protein